MNRLTLKKKNIALRANRTRAKVQGTAERPRLSVNVSNMHVSAQLINDESHETVASSSTVGQKALAGTMTEKASWVGEQIAAAAKAKKIKVVVFDRGAKKYHGRVKALADAARAAGLEF